ncbi:phage tail protein [Brevibacillus panacihumi]|uniref:Phage tail protein n=1 Tax=Brevibacillus panacihumi TaxID=497735 RepID=A0A3M8C902_9BACL|nr:phage tail protein [Brevibacillus panacihumi]RNB72186.1 phage tail protein [Brevibacillus panacihumi]
MAENFYTIVTNIGKAKIANATALGTKVNIVQMAVGDGNGVYYNPTENQTSLRHEVWRGSINSIKPDEQNPYWVVTEIVIPSDVGGFTIREVGVFDDQGDLIAVGKYPETYKPVLADGSAKDLFVRMILEVTNTSSVTLKVDPSIVLASREYVNDSIDAAKKQLRQYVNDSIAKQVESIADKLANYKKFKSGKDANGIFTVVEYRRVADNTLYMKSTLSNPDADGNYQTDTRVYYKMNGVDVDHTVIVTLTYDPDGDVVSEVPSA